MHDETAGTLITCMAAADVFTTNQLIALLEHTIL